MSAVADAIEALRQAMLDEGQDPGTVEAKLHMAKPNETNIVGNYADLQRMGAIAQQGILPTPPAEEDIETSNIEDAFIEVPGPIDDDTGRPVTGGNGDDEGVDTRTKAELQAELDDRGIAWNSGDTKADLLDRLAE